MKLRGGWNKKASDMRHYREVTCGIKECLPTDGYELIVRLLFVTG